MTARYRGVALAVPPRGAAGHQYSRRYIRNIHDLRSPFPPGAPPIMSPDPNLSGQSFARLGLVQPILFNQLDLRWGSGVDDDGSDAGDRVGESRVMECKKCANVSVR
jgi:hypothetical protein